MSGPWEKYKSQSPASSDGPWAKYASQSAPAEEPIAGLAPGQKLPGMHAAPKPQMQEVVSPTQILDSGVDGALKGVNPVNMAKGLYGAGKAFIDDPTGEKRGTAETDQYINQIQHPGEKPSTNQVLRDIAGSVGNMAGQLALTEGIGRGINAVKAPIGARLAAEEANLDSAGIVPDAQKLMNRLDAPRNKNLSSQGVPYNRPLENSFQGVEDQIHGIYTNPHMPAKFSDVSGLKSSLQKQASPTFFDTGDVVPSKQGMGQSSRAIRAELRETPGAEDWAKLQDSATRRHRIDEGAGYVGGVLGAAAGPIMGIRGGHGIMGALGIPAGMKAGQALGKAASHYVTSGEAAQQLKPITPVVRVLPLVKKDENQ